MGVGWWLRSQESPMYVPRHINFFSIFFNVSSYLEKSQLSFKKSLTLVIEGTADKTREPQLYS